MSIQNNLSAFEPNLQVSSSERPAEKFLIKFWFEWHGGCLWAGNDSARTAFDIGPIENILPVSEETRHRLTELSIWHDTSLNWEYPPDPGPWSPEEHERFDQAALEILVVIRSELGTDFDVKDDRVVDPSEVAEVMARYDLVAVSGEV